MFRTAELGRTVSRADYHEQVPILRAELLELQQQLRADAPFPVIVVFGGVDGAGKSETINLLHEWMDPRWLTTRAYGEPSDEMRDRPEYWRFWRDLPPKGRIGLFLSCWYSRPTLDRVYERSSEAELDEALDRVFAFEKELADDGALIIKFWMHLGKKAQKERLEALQKDPLTRWRVTKTDWDHWHMYDRFIAAAERLITRTSTGHAPWHIVEGFDKRYRGLTVGITLRNAIVRHLEEMRLRRDLIAARDGRLHDLSADDRETVEPSPADPVPGETRIGGTVLRMPRITILSQLDSSQAVDRKDYKLALEKCQGKVNRRCRRAKELGVSTILVFEGWDAAGKGGAVRRVTAALDARDFQIIPVASPTDEEQAHHYLWRFWRHLSRAGRVTIFDRSWYGRVLVERVEGFASEQEWRRAYAEINDFEDQLVRHGIVLCKFWLHITKDEQLKRFKTREKVAYKRWKLTEEDWRNREKWDDYEAAVNDMVERTSTSIAPWTLVEANDKRFARIKVLKTIRDAVEAGIARTGHPYVPEGKASKHTLESTA
ncbi:MAG: polyphosphate kinase [Rhodospirillales bacterium]|nr:MAG: polyphosphate kinase [Rhodospirillales bacterium]